MHRNVPKLQNQPAVLQQQSNNNIDKGVTMSKIKDELERIREREYEQYISFMEWVCEQKTEVSMNVTNEEEESSEEPSTTGTSIVPANTLKPVNNPNYNPTRSIR
jgi:hypothetical protein